MSGKKRRMCSRLSVHRRLLLSSEKLIPPWSSRSWSGAFGWRGINVGNEVVMHLENDDESVFPVVGSSMDPGLFRTKPLRPFVCLFSVSSHFNHRLYFSLSTLPSQPFVRVVFEGDFADRVSATILGIVFVCSWLGRVFSFENVVWQAERDEVMLSRVKRFRNEGSHTRRRKVAVFWTLLKLEVLGWQGVRHESWWPLLKRGEPRPDFISRRMLRKTGYLLSYFCIVI